MENYQIIKNYLGTFPGNTTVEDILANITKAEEMYNDNIEKQKSRMNDNIGKCYYWDDIDDSVCMIKFFYKITGIKEIGRREDGNTHILYECEMIELGGENGMYHTDCYNITESDMNEAKEITSEKFNEIKELIEKVENYKL